MNEILDYVPVFFATVVFACFFAFFHFKKHGACEKQAEYQRLRNEFFDHLPAKEILTLEDFRIVQALISSSEIEGVYLLLSKNVIEEKAWINDEVQFQLKVFLNKALPIIKTIDMEDTGRNAIVTECKNLFKLYANRDTRLIFKDETFLYMKW